MCSARIQSGWRPLFSALETVHSNNKSEVKDYLVGEYSMGRTFLYSFVSSQTLAFFKCMFFFKKARTIHSKLYKKITDYNFT